MPRPPQHNQKSLMKLLKAAGWAEEQGGKHVVKMTRAGQRPITLPHDKGGGGYPVGLTTAILKQAGLREGGSK